LEPIALAALGGTARPRGRVVRALAAKLKPAKERGDSGTVYENIAILTTLGRMGTGAREALPAVRALPADQPARDEALERLGEPVAGDTSAEAFGQAHRKSKIHLYRGWAGSMSRINDRVTG